MADVLGFHAYFPALGFDKAGRALDAALVGEGLESGGWQGQAFRQAQYSDGSLELTFDMSDETPWSQVQIGYLPSTVVARVGPDRIADCLGAACTALGVLLGRTHGGGGPGLVQPAELTGTLTCLHWWQFLGASVLARLDQTRVERTPCFTVVAAPRSSLILRIAREPFDITDHIALAEAHLGLTRRRGNT